MEERSSSTPNVPTNLITLLNTGRGIGIETCEVNVVFPPDDIWFGSDTITKCAVIYDSIIFEKYIM